MSDTVNTPASDPADGPANTPICFIPPGGIGPGTPQDALAKAIAKELAIEGFDHALALPVAIGILGCVQEVLDANSLEAGIATLEQRRMSADCWWVEHHPKTKFGRGARDRLRATKERESSAPQ